jgi:hypothetical protein
MDVEMKGQSREGLAAMLDEKYFAAVQAAARATNAHRVDDSAVKNAQTSSVRAELEKVELATVTDPRQLTQLFGYVQSAILDPRARVDGKRVPLGTFYSILNAVQASEEIKGAIAGMVVGRYNTTGKMLAAAEELAWDRIDFSVDAITKAAILLRKKAAAIEQGELDLVGLATQKLDEAAQALVEARARGDALYNELPFGQARAEANKIEGEAYRALKAAESELARAENASNRLRELAKVLEEIRNRVFKSGSRNSDRSDRTGEVEARGLKRPNLGGSMKMESIDAGKSSRRQPRRQSRRSQRRSRGADYRHRAQGGDEE